MNFSRKNGGGTNRCLEIEEGDISDQPGRIHDIHQETIEKSFLGTGWVSKEPAKDLIRERKSFTRCQGRKLSAAHNGIR